MSAMQQTPQDGQRKRTPTRRAATPRRSPGFLGGGWPMHRAVWLPLLLLGLPLVLGMSLLDAWLAQAAGPLRWATAAALLLALLMPLSVGLWSLGTWRAASAWIARGQAPWVAWLSRGIVLALSVLALAWLAAITSTRWAQHLGLVQGRDAAGMLSITASADGQALHLAGRIGAGDAQRIRQALDRLPGLQRMELAIEAGRLGEANVARAAIAPRRLQAVALGPCGNACALLMAGAATRMAVPEGRPWFEREASGRFNRAMQVLRDRFTRQAFMQAGVDARFIERLLRAPPGLRWQPGIDELEEIGLLSPPARPLDVLLPASAQADVADLVLALRARPAWAAAGERQPGLLDEAAVRMQAARTVEDEAGVQRVAQNLLPPWWTAWLASASDELRQQHLALLLAQMEALPAQCRELLAGDAAARSALPLELARQEARWMTELAREAPGRLPRRRVTGIEGEVLQRSLGATASLLAQGRWRNPSTRAPGCERERALLRDVLALAPSERRLALRVMFETR